MSDGLRDAAARRGSLWQTVRAVFWSFFGVRRSSDLQADAEKLNPLHVAAAGIAGAALFVIGLWLLVRWIVGSGVAAVS